MSANEPLRQSPSDIPYLSNKDLTLADVMRKLEAIEREIVPLKEAITGNGKPMDGLSVRVALLEDWKKDSNRRATWHTLASIVNLLILAGLIFWMLLNAR